MLIYIARRVVMAIPFFFLVSITVFALIQLPPGDFVDSYAAARASTGEDLSLEVLANMRERFGLNQPFIVQYFTWMGGVLRGDFGYSFEWNAPVSELLGERMGLTVILSMTTLLFTWVIALPVGIYSAVNRYTPGDYAVTFLSFLGLAVPNFLLALVLMYVAVVHFGMDVSGLFSPEFQNEPWSWPRAANLAQHLWIPMIILGTSAAASLIRIMRANLVDQLHMPYVTTARAKGLTEMSLLLRYPVRIALNPFVSTIGWSLPHIVSGTVIVSIVLNLPTAGPLLYQSLLSQDIYLSGAFLLMLCSLTVIGTLISDILLMLLDPRIR
jgi:peptide/nickel transport system permease protein